MRFDEDMSARDMFIKEIPVHVLVHVSMSSSYAMCHPAPNGKHIGAQATQQFKKPQSGGIVMCASVKALQSSRTLLARISPGPACKWHLSLRRQTIDRAGEAVSARIRPWKGPFQK